MAFLAFLINLSDKTYYIKCADWKGNLPKDVAGRETVCVDANGKGGIILKPY